MQTFKKPKSRANAMTAAIIDYCNAIGWTVWRNNTTGLFDPSSAAEKLVDIDTSNWDLPQFMRFFAKQYRRTTGRIGGADILGYTRQGVHVEIEIKAGNDVLSIEQQQCLIECIMKGGKAYVIAENPEKVRKAAKVFGFDLVPVLTIDQFCDLHKNWGV